MNGIEEVEMQILRKKVSLYLDIFYHLKELTCKQDEEINQSIIHALMDNNSLRYLDVKFAEYYSKLDLLNDIQFGKVK